MRIQLQSSFSKLFFAFGCVVLASVYLFSAVRTFWADRLAVFRDAGNLRRAIALEPSNAKYQDLLGRYLFYSEQDLPGAQACYQRAVAMNPHSSSYWLGLARVLQVLGDSPGQIAAIERATQVDAKTPAVAWEAGNLFLIAGQSEAALSQFHTVLREHIGEIPIRRPLEMSWRAAHDVHKVEAILPAEPDIWLDFIEMLLEKQEIAAAETAWQDLISQKISFDAKHGLFYVDYWIAHHDGTRAQQSWQQLVAADTSLAHYSDAGNLVVNGGFEHDLLNGGFDWRYVSTSAVATSLETDDAHGGMRSLVLSFLAATTPNAGVFQVISVEPNTKYRFSAYVKGEDISSANGPRLSIYDSLSHQNFWLSDETLGTTAWHELNGRFTTGSETTLVILDIVRTSSTTHINGKLWLDDVNLTRE